MAKSNRKLKDILDDVENGKLKAKEAEDEIVATFGDGTKLPPPNDG